MPSSAEAMGPIVLCCCSTSVETWWRHFLSASVAHSTLWLGSDARSVDALFHELSAFASGPGPSANFLVLSEHGTLQRDSQLIDKLRLAGYYAVGASSKLTKFELEKIAARRFFDEAGIRSPRWATSALPIGPQLRKRSVGTAASDIRWHNGESYSGEGQYYYEEYIEGTEYSVNAILTDAGCTFLPPVWKGETNRELVPPYRRLRLCGPSVVSGEMQQILWDASRQITVHFSEACLLEIEFVVDSAGHPHVLEVNPRVSGTTKMASMAAGIKVFDLFARSEALGALEPQRVTAELPVIARGVAIGHEDFFATSRLTVASDSWGGLMDKINMSEHAGWRTDPTETRRLKSWLSQVAAEGA